jgi:hypothetical protein
MIAAVTGDDVVQLVENYKGAKKLQVGLFGIFGIAFVICMVPTCVRDWCNQALRAVLMFQEPA